MQLQEYKIEYGAIVGLDSLPKNVMDIEINKDNFLKISKSTTTEFKSTDINQSYIYVVYGLNNLNRSIASNFLLRSFVKSSSVNSKHFWSCCLNKTDLEIKITRAVLGYDENVLEQLTNARILCITGITKDVSVSNFEFVNGILSNRRINNNHITILESEPLIKSFAGVKLVQDGIVLDRVRLVETK